ncbi:MULTISPECIES: OsmC family protein [unclassified Pseudomonas]|uniref:OsmC family protein n=1 Tax=unclassified Pseudomonas TaxID=196821 RepID=UPI002AC8D7F3|nr:MULTISPECIES: OsmC family protein [unclassified Pseudomonas]MEB0040562.1 OsmC family protein [Pseudomonas sp. MH10]MEB0079562.1 OsmC family protein [Pseudomonas sp. MH10out]MEB0091353.1 OsmC family protein [Pseudomonas sp. CCI4.2]MEB0101227.1 OsmC family protein [Pseudomonas sp. CCI3.2]MEB0119842.1 OsmC family protein [Pseudomonas sp. CCI1.2]
MSVTINTLSSTGYRHTIEVDEKHPLFTDLPVSAGGEGSAPDPHDYFDVALGACKALTVKLYAKQHDIPLTGVTVEVNHDGSLEREGKYAISVQLTLLGALSDEQRTLLHRIADRCPVHKLMTRTEVTIETHLAEGAFSQ